MSNRNVGLVVLAILAFTAVLILVIDKHPRQFDGTYSQYLGGGETRVISPAMMEELMSTTTGGVQVASADVDYTGFGDAVDNTILLHAATYQDAVKYLPADAILITVHCANPGESYTTFKFDDATMLGIANSYCEDKVEFWFWYFPALPAPSGGLSA